MNYQDLDKVCEIDDKKLYAEVVKSGLPFFQWPKWLEQKITRLMMEKMLQMRMQRKARQLSSNKQVQGEVLSNSYFASYTLKQDHFYSLGSS
jgi:hypothetical protein